MESWRKTLLQFTNLRLLAEFKLNFASFYRAGKIFKYGVFNQ